MSEPVLSRTRTSYRRISHVTDDGELVQPVAVSPSTVPEVLPKKKKRNPYEDMGRRTRIGIGIILCAVAFGLLYLQVSFVTNLVDMIPGIMGGVRLGYGVWISLTTTLSINLLQFLRKSGFIARMARGGIEGTSKLETLSTWFTRVEFLSVFFALSMPMSWPETFRKDFASLIFQLVKAVVTLLREVLAGRGDGKAASIAAGDSIIFAFILVVIAVIALLITILFEELLTQGMMALGLVQSRNDTLSIKQMRKMLRAVKRDNSQSLSKEQKITETLWLEFEELALRYLVLKTDKVEQYAIIRSLGQVIRAGNAIKFVRRASDDMSDGIPELQAVLTSDLMELSEGEVSNVA